MDPKSLIFSPGRVALGVIAPVLNELNIDFDLGCWKQQQMLSLSRGVTLTTPLSVSNFYPKIVFEPDFTDYNRIFVSVGLQSHKQILKNIRLTNTAAQVIFFENILEQEQLPGVDNIEYVLLDRIITTRNFEPDGVKIFAEDFLELRSGVEFLDGHASHKFLTPSQQSISFEKKFMFINLFHKIISLLAMSENISSNQKYLECFGETYAFELLEKTLGKKFNQVDCELSRKLVQRLYLAPVDHLSRVINPYGQKLLQQRVDMLGLDSSVINKLFESIYSET